MEKFTFLDYLEFILKNTEQEKANDTIIEIDNLKSHTATIKTMQKHLKQYQAMIKIISNGIQILDV